jgi:hypothetical protein
MKMKYRSSAFSEEKKTDEFRDAAHIVGLQKHSELAFSTQNSRATKAPIR